MNWQKTYRLVSNKYILSISLFIVWVSFFDRNSLISQYRLSQELNRLEKEKAFYIEQIEKDSKATHDLLNNIEVIEKFARENHMMKRDNEDIFLIVRKPAEQKD